jgi:hypothetical protein
MIAYLRQWWQQRTGEEETPFDGDTPAWALSIGVHLLALVALALAPLLIQRHAIELQVFSVSEEPEPIIENFAFSKETQEEIGANSIDGVAEALAVAPTIDEVSDVPTKIEQSDVSTVEVAVNLDIATGPNFAENMAVKGAAGVGTTGAAGAIDRLTQEILDSLAERKTLVVWLFDQSGSLQQQRGDIHARFDRIYQELGVIEASGNEAFKKHDDKPLLSAVMAFGDKVSFRAEPTDRVEQLKEAIAGIENDPSGVERVFTAVGTAAQKYAKYRHEAPRRNVMLVIVSDEVGDDENRMEEALALCRRHEMPVYCIGIPAPFGREIAVVKYVDPDPQYDQSVQWIPVRQGPESVRPERLKLAFSGEANFDDSDRLDSGFGPFALTRLCFETGGIYFAVHPNRNSSTRFVSAGDTAVMSARIQHFFDPGIMRRYRPDYLSLQEYDQLLQQNKARAALVQASTMSVGAMENPQLTFPKRDEGDLKRLLDEAQKVAASLEPKIEALYQTLKAGEKDRPKLTQPRWQAGYDLAMGRVLATKVRTESYNAMLASLKGGKKFENESSDTWVLKPADTITVGSALEKLGKQSRELLEKVVKEHTGTPWALLAERELKVPLGWQWTEANTGVGREQMADGNGNNNNNNNNLNRLMKPKPTRPNVKL